MTNETALLALLESREAEANAKAEWIAEWCETMPPPCWLPNWKALSRPLCWPR